MKYQRNIELGLDRRFQEGLGVGNKFFTSTRIYAWARSGMVFNQEKGANITDAKTLTELFGQIEFNFFKFSKPEMNFIIAQSFYYSLSQKGRFRNDGEISLHWTIVKDFKLEFTFYNNFDNQPPSEGDIKLDYGIIFSLNYVLK